MYHDPSEYHIDFSFIPNSTASSQESPAGVTTHITRATTSTSSLKKSTSNHIPNLDWSAFRRPRWQYKRASIETKAPTLSINPEEGASGLSTGTTIKSDTEETPSENTTGLLSSEVIKLDVAATPAVISTSLSSPVSIAQAPPQDHRMETKSKESRTPKVR